jgi:hypothetical protein
MSLLESQPDSEADCPAARLLPALRENRIELPSGIDSQVVILDPNNGQLLALATIQTSIDSSGAIQHQYTSENPYAPHPTGTIITPFIYLSGFTRGFSPASLVWDVPTNSASLTSDELKRYHGPVRARLALTNDYLAPAAQILDQVGVGNVLKIAAQMNTPLQNVSSGIPGDEKADLTAFLDESASNLIQLSQAFGVLSNNGNLVGSTSTDAQGSIQPLTILLMEDYQGYVWLGDPTLSGRDNLASRPVISPQLAYLVTNSLSDESARWPWLGHPNALEIGKPAAVKFGSAIEGTGLWTIGYLPQLVVGVHLAFSQEKPPAALSQDSIMDIWHSLVQYASQALPVQDWAPPPGIVQMVVCDPSGMLPDKDCPSTVSEVFLESNTPTQTDDFYQSLQVNRETGRLATIFTPPEFIENRLYMNIPSWALAWAKAANLPIPPDSYDVIQAGSASQNVEAHIDQPGMLSYVRGQVKINGSAGGAGFSSYRLSAGKGLYPADWLQIGEESDQPVENGSLGVWDTAGLNGLYSIQLTLIHQDQSVDTSIVQVTVDNVAPVIARLYPTDGQTLVIPSNGLLTIQPEVSDDLGIERVEISLDGKLVATLHQAPFAYPWQATVGKHKLQVEVFDLAGNSTQASGEFNLTLK